MEQARGRRIKLSKRKPKPAVRTCAESLSLKETPYSIIEPRIRLQSSVKGSRVQRSAKPSPLPYRSPAPFRSVSCDRRKISENSRLVSANAYLDGTWSSSSSSSDEEPSAGENPQSHKIATASLHTPAKPRTPATHPCRRGLRPGALTSFWSDPGASRHHQRQTSPDGTPSKLPSLSDRFVPSRERLVPLSERFRTAKESQRMSAAERILRSDDATPDPFCSRLPRPAPDGVPQPRSRPPGTNRRRGKIKHTETNSRIGFLTVSGTTVGFIPYNAVTLNSFERQVGAP